MRRLNYFLAAFILLAGAVLLTSTAARAQQEQGFPKSPSFSKPDDAQNCPPKLPGPVIMQLGPPPNLYSPAADFKSRVSAPAFAVVGDQGGTATPSVAVAPFAAAPFAAMPFAATPGACNDCGCSPGQQFSTGPIGAAPVYQPPMQNYGIPTPFYFPTPALQPTLPPAPTVYTAAVNPPAAHVYFPTASAPAPMPAIYPTTVPGYYPPMPSANVAYGRAYSSPAAGEADRLEHMLEAVHQLEAAGLQADADQLRRKCDGSMKVVIESLKTAEANATVHNLPNPVTPNPLKYNSDTTMSAAPNVPYCTTAAPQQQKQVVVHVQMLEVNRTKMRNLGFDFEGPAAETMLNLGKNADLVSKTSYTKAAPADTTRFGVSDASKPIADFLKALRHEGAVKMLADPTLVTVSGRPASMHVGGEVPYPKADATGAFIGYEKVGSEVNIVPMLIGKDRLRLGISTSFSEVDPGRQFEVQGVQYPVIKSHAIDTAAELQSGQTLVIGGLTENRVVAIRKDPPESTEEPTADNAEGEAARPMEVADAVRFEEQEIEYVVLVRPEVVQPAGEFTQTSAVAAPAGSGYQCACDPYSCPGGQCGGAACGQMAAAAGLIPQAFPCYDADSGKMVLKPVGIGRAAPSACDCPTAGACDCSSSGACNCPTANAAANPAGDKLVTVSMQMLELNRTKCEEEGIELSDNVADLIDRLDSLKKQGVLEVVSRPKVMTASGMTAYLEIGRRLPLDEQLDATAGETEPQFGESKTVGTKFEVRPTIQADNKIRLQLHCLVSSYNVGSAAQADGVIAPAIEGHDIQTMLRLPSGETGLLAVATKKRYETQVVEHVEAGQLPDGTEARRLVAEQRIARCEIQLLVLVRPEIVDAKDSSKVLSSNEDGWPRSEAAKLAWRPVRDSATDAQLQSGETQAERRHTSTLDNPFEDEVAPTHIELSGFFKEESLFEVEQSTDGASIGCPSGLNLLENQHQKFNEPFPSGTGINFQQEPAPQHYEIDPATFKFPEPFVEGERLMLGVGR